MINNKKKKKNFFKLRLQSNTTLKFTHFTKFKQYSAGVCLIKLLDRRKQLDAVVKNLFNNTITKQKINK